MPLPSQCPLCNANSSSQYVITKDVYGHSRDSEYAFYNCRKCYVNYQFPQLSPKEENQF